VGAGGCDAPGYPTNHSTQQKLRHGGAPPTVRISSRGWRGSQNTRTRPKIRIGVANVLPGLVRVTLTAIAKPTGMSTSNAAKVRSGKRVPHPRHWAGLVALR